MNYREVQILAPETIDTAATKTIDVNIDQPLSRIEIYWQITKADTAGDSVAHNVADLTKIELVDGSDVLFSCSGYEAQALNLYDRRIPTMSHGQHLVANSEAIVVGIDFGRYLWDELLALNPAMFRNLQLKISYTLTSSDASASAAEMEVVGYVFDEKVISPIGFLMSKEVVNQSNPANDSYKYIDLPTDYPIRKLILRAEEDDYAPWDCIEGFRLDEDNLKRIPLDWATERYYRMMKGVWQRLEETFLVAIPTAGCTQYVTPTDYFMDAHFMQISGGMGNVTCSVATGGKLAFDSDVAGTIQGGIAGYLPHHCFEFPFGKQDVIEDWYDVTKLGSIRARVRGGSVGTGGTHQLVLQQLRR